MPSVPEDLKGIITPRRVNKKKLRKRMNESERRRLKKEFLEEYRKESSTMNKAAKKIGFSRQVLYKWTDSDPEFAKEFEELRFIKKHNSKKKFEERHKYDEQGKEMFLKLYADDTYSVASALEEISEKIGKKIDLQHFKYWEKTDLDFKKQYYLLQLKTRPTLANGVELHKSIASEKVRLRQNEFLEVFRKCHFNITNACNQMGIRRQLVTDWGRKDPDFASKINALQDEKEDYVESKLFELIEAGNMPATIFASKIMLNQPNFGRRHAYIEQPQRIEGKIEHKHKFDQDQLDAMVRGRQIDRAKYAKILEIDDPNILDGEIVDESSC